MSTCLVFLKEYYKAHELTEDRLTAFQENVIPRIQQNDNEVAILIRENSTSGSQFSRHYGQYGAGDFVIGALTSKINPENINELMLASREVATTDSAKFERNRLDAAELQGVFFRDRAFVHDNVPGTHQVLSAMLDFYESRNDPEAHHEKADILENILNEQASGVYGGHYHGMIDRALDIDNYEKETFRRSKMERSNGDTPEKAIDALRRLVENTAHLVTEKPKTEDDAINQLINQLEVRTNDETGEVHVNWQQIGNLVAEANQYLIRRQGEGGITPSMISALSYIDRMSMFALKDISDKDWHELPFDLKFKEMVRFQELTGSMGKYNESRFERFYQGLITDMSKDYQDDNVARGVYQDLQRHILNNLYPMAEKYDSNPNTEFRVGALWSGNLAHELIGLADR